MNPNTIEIPTLRNQRRTTFCVNKKKGSLITVSNKIGKQMVEPIVRHMTKEQIDRFKFQCELPLNDDKLPYNGTQTTSPRSIQTTERAFSQQMGNRTSQAKNSLATAQYTWMSLNYMSKQILFSTNQVLNLYSIPKSKIVAKRTFADILNEPQGKSELYQIENLQPLLLKNIWVGAKNKKQLIFFNSHLDKGTDPAADSSGIIDVKVNQKSEEILTLGKDFKQIRIWIYDIIEKNPKKYNKDDRVIKKFQTFDVTVSNRKNIYFNTAIATFEILSEMDMLILSGSMINEITVWSTNDGSKMHNIDMETYTLIDKGYEKIIGSAFIKEASNKQGNGNTNSQNNQQTVIKKQNQCIIATCQEFIIIFSNQKKKLIVWDIVRQTAIFVKSMKQIKGSIINMLPISADIFTGGLILLDDQQLIYEYSLTMIKIQNVYNTQLRQYEDSDQYMSPSSSPLSLKCRAQRSQNSTPSKRTRSQDDITELQTTTTQRIFFLAIENGNGQIYIMRDNNIDIVEVFASIRPAFNLKPLNFTDKIISASIETLQFENHRGVQQALHVQNKNGELIISKVSDIIQSQQKSKVLVRDNCYFVTNAAKLLSSCVDQPTTAIQNSTLQASSNMDNQSDQNETYNNQNQLVYNSLNADNFIGSQVLFHALDLELGIAAFFNSEGMLAVANLYTMVGKVLPLGFQGSVQKIMIIEKDNSDNTYYKSLQKHKNSFVVSLDSLKGVLSQTRLNFDEFTYVAEPNFSILLICECDIVEIRNDVKNNTFLFKNKFPFNDKLIDAHYYKDKLTLYIVCRDGYIKEVETESFTQKRLIKMYWNNISSSFINNDMMIILGHEKGIITSQNLEADMKKTNTLERKFKVHDFHRKKIISINSAAHNKSQFVSLCQENIVALWLIDGERPLKVFYFNNRFSQVIAMQPDYTQTKQIESFLVVSSQKIYSCDVSSAPYYKSYNEDIGFEWQCFAYEMNKQLQKVKRSLQDAKIYENNRRFNAQKCLPELLKIKKQKQSINSYIDVTNLAEKLDIVSDNDQQEEFKEESQKYNQQLQPYLFQYLAGNYSLPIPVRLLEYEYYIFCKQFMSLNSELERRLVQQTLIIDYNYLKLVKDCSREQILGKNKTVQATDRAHKQIAKVQQQTNQISSKLVLKGSQSQRSIDSIKTIQLKARQLFKLNQQRKFNPVVAMNLLSLPEEHNQHQHNIRIAYGQQKLLKRHSSVGEIQDNGNENPTQSLRNTQATILPSLDKKDNKNKNSESKQSNLQVSQNEKRLVKSLVETQSQEQKNSANNIQINLPQITMNEYSKELSNLRDQLKHREQFFITEENDLVINRAQITKGHQTARNFTSPAKTKEIEDNIKFKLSSELKTAKAPFFVKNQTKDLKEGIQHSQNKDFVQKQIVLKITPAENNLVQSKIGTSKVLQQTKQKQQDGKDIETLKGQVLGGTGPLEDPPQEKRKFSYHQIVLPRAHSVRQPLSIQAQLSAGTNYNMEIKETFDSNEDIKINTKMYHTQTTQHSPQQWKKAFQNQRIQQEITVNAPQIAVFDMQEENQQQQSQNYDTNIERKLSTKNLDVHMKVQNQNQQDGGLQIFKQSGHQCLVSNQNCHHVVDIKQHLEDKQMKVNAIKQYQSMVVNKAQDVKKWQKQHHKGKGNFQDLIIQPGKTKIEPSNKDINHKYRLDVGQDQIIENMLENNLDNQQNLLTSQSQNINNNQEVLGAFDNIDYVENFLNFKYDPYELFQFFEVRGLDIEQLSWWQLREYLIQYIQANLANKKLTNQEKVEQVKALNKLKKEQQKELFQLKCEAKQVVSYRQQRELLEQINKHNIEENLRRQGKGQEHRTMLLKKLLDKEIQRSERTNEREQKMIVSITNKNKKTSNDNKTYFHSAESNQIFNIEKFVRKDIVQKIILNSVFQQIDKQALQNQKENQHKRRQTLNLPLQSIFEAQNEEKLQQMSPSKQKTLNTTELILNLSQENSNYNDQSFSQRRDNEINSNKKSISPKKQPLQKQGYGEVINSQDLSQITGVNEYNFVQLVASPYDTIQEVEETQHQSRLNTNVGNQSFRKLKASQTFRNKSPAKNSQVLTMGPNVKVEKSKTQKQSQKSLAEYNQQVLQNVINFDQDINTSKMGFNDEEFVEMVQKSIKESQDHQQKNEDDEMMSESLIIKGTNLQYTSQIDMMKKKQSSQAILSKRDTRGIFDSYDSRSGKIREEGQSDNKDIDQLLIDDGNFISDNNNRKIYDSSKSITAQIESLQNLPNEDQKIIALQAIYKDIKNQGNRQTDIQQEITQKDELGKDKSKPLHSPNKIDASKATNEDQEHVKISLQKQVSFKKQGTLSKQKSPKSPSSVKKLQTLKSQDKDKKMEVIDKFQIHAINLGTQTQDQNQQASSQLSQNNDNDNTQPQKMSNKLLNELIGGQIKTSITTTQQDNQNTNQVIDSALKLTKNESKTQGSGMSVKEKSPAFRNSITMKGNSPDSTNRRTSVMKAQIGQAFVKRMSKRVSRLGQSPDGAKKKQGLMAVEEADTLEKIDVPLEMVEEDVQLVKEKLFSILSANIFEQKPEEKLQRIKLAILIENMTLEQFQELGIKVNFNKDNILEIYEILEKHQKEQEAKNQEKGAFKINKKMFSEIKKRLMPSQKNGKTNSSNFLAALVSQKQPSIDEAGSPQNKRERTRTQSVDKKDEGEQQNEDTEDDEEEKDQMPIGSNYNEMLKQIFDEDKDFNVFRGKLKEYRMKFGQQTQFTESVKDLEEADRRDYDTFGRLETFKKTHKKVQEIKDKKRKKDTVLSEIQDTTLGSGGLPNEVIHAQLSGTDNKKVLINVLADEIMNMLIEVKRRNRFNEMKKKKTQREQANQESDVSSSDNDDDDKIDNFNINLNKNESNKNLSPSNLVHSSKSLDKSQKGHQAMMMDKISQEQQELLQKYKINFNKKHQLAQMSDIEISERKYGALVKKGVDYLNPALSQRYVERTFFQPKLPQWPVKEINFPRAKDL